MVKDGINTAEYHPKTGKCVRHPAIRLRKKKVFGGWKIVIGHCPECCLEEMRRVRDEIGNVDLNKNNHHRNDDDEEEEDYEEGEEEEEESRISGRVGGSGGGRGSGRGGGRKGDDETDDGDYDDRPHSSSRHRSSGGGKKDKKKKRSGGSERHKDRGERQSRGGGGHREHRDRDHDMDRDKVRDSRGRGDDEGAGSIEGGGGERRRGKSGMHYDGSHHQQQHQSPPPLPLRTMVLSMAFTDQRTGQRGTYTGQINSINRMPDGKGTVYYTNGSIAEGTWMSGILLESEDAINGRRTYAVDPRVGGGGMIMRGDPPLIQGSSVRRPHTVHHPSNTTFGGGNLDQLDRLGGKPRHSQQRGASSVNSYNSRGSAAGGDMNNVHHSGSASIQEYRGAFNTYSSSPSGVMGGGGAPYRKTDVGGYWQHGEQQPGRNPPGYR